MAEEKEPFLSRWSRLKTESREAPRGAGRTGGGSGPVSAGAAAPAAAGASAPPALPPLETLTPKSDFAPFMQRGVEEALRRAALKKLFSDPLFNVPDPYESHSIDWTQGNTPGSEIVAKLERAREKLAGAEESAPETSPEEARAGGEDAPDARPQTVESAATPQADEGRRQDGVAGQNA